MFRYAIRPATKPSTDFEVLSYYHASFQVEKNAKYGPISDDLLNQKLPIFIVQLLPNLFFARLIKNSQRQNHSLRNPPTSFVTLPTFLTKSNYNIPLNHTFCSVTCQTVVGSQRPDTLITQN